MECCEDVRGSDCHCGDCHQTFSSLQLFDRHQNVTYSRHATIVCRVPATLGLVQDYRGTWTTPQAAISRQAKSLAMAERKRAPAEPDVACVTCQPSPTSP